VEWNNRDHGQEYDLDRADLAANIKSCFSDRQYLLHQSFF